MRRRPLSLKAVLTSIAMLRPLRQSVAPLLLLPVPPLLASSPFLPCVLIITAFRECTSSLDLLRLDLGGGDLDLDNEREELLEIECDRDRLVVRLRLSAALASGEGDLIHRCWR